MVRDNKKAFTPAPEGLHQAVCVDVVDLGLVEGPWGAKPTVEIRWELDLTHEETGRPFLVSKRYTLTLNEKGNLRPMLEAWRGRKFTPQELEGFDLERLLGGELPAPARARADRPGRALRQRAGRGPARARHDEAPAERGLRARVRPPGGAGERERGDRRC
jgi:hypothetical protein